MTDHAKSTDERKTKKQVVRELKSLRRNFPDAALLLAELIRIYKEAPVGLCYFDTNLRFLHINDRLAAINGMPVEEHLGRTIGEVLPDDSAGVESQLRQVIETGEPIVGEAVDVATAAHPGLTRTFEHDYFPIKFGDDMVVGVSCVVQEITERKRAEEALRKANDKLERRVEERTSKLKTVNTKLLGEIAEHERTEKALRESEERFKDFAELASDWFWEMDENLRYAYFSERSTPEDRISLDALLGKTRQEWAAADEDSELWGSHLDTLAARKPFRGFTYSRLDDHGAVMHIRVNGNPLFDADETFIGYRGTGADVTAEVETLRFLRAARDESQLANAAKSEFLANMSHELRTPLNAVVGFSDVMKQGILGPVGNPKYLEYAEDIHDAGNHLLNLINDILDLSKVEAGKDELQEEVIEIAGLLDSVRMLVSGRAEREGVALEFDVARGLPALRADGRKLKQIFVNLLSNAIKFTDAGGRVTFRVWHRADSGMVFQVADTGIGIAAEDISIAMAPFQQVEQGLARKYQGTGLGLTLAKSLAEMHGGYLDLQSQPGEGTTVTVRLPPGRVVANRRRRRKRAS